MLWAILVCFGAAAVVPVLYRYAPRQARWLGAVVPLALAAYFAGFANVIRSGVVVREAQPWVPSVGVELAFRLDGLALLLALLITGIGALVLLYAGSYVAGDARPGRMPALLLGFMGAMLGLVLADHLILLYVFWELTSLFSFLLIGFHGERAAARDAAVQALVVTTLGGVALLAGVILLGHAADSFLLSEILERGDAIAAHAHYPGIVALVLAGAFVKSAQLPFHFWLPDAMQAPTPVSAYLHSATMVKAGIYLLLRMLPVLGESALWVWAAAIVGGATALWAALEALRHTDMKRILAYTTVAALGQLVLLIGLGEAGAEAAVVFLLAHALYKGALFLIAGAVEHETGTRDITQMGGLRRRLPTAGAAALLAGLSMAGLPPLLGFISKEALYGAKLGFSSALTPVLIGLGLTVNALTFAAALLIVLGVFFGPLRPADSHADATRKGLLVGPLVLAACGLLFGLTAPWLARVLLAPAAGAVTEQPVVIEAELWGGWHIEVLLSVATIALGTLIYVRRRPLLAALARTAPLARWGPAAAYAGAVAGLLRLGDTQMRLAERRSLAYSMYAVFLLFACGVGAALVDAPMRIDVAGAGLLHEWFLAALICAAAVTAAVAMSRLLAMTALGVAGFGVALIFAWFGAPDLAMAQFLVETLSVIVAGLVLVHLPRFRQIEPPARAGAVVHAIVAAAVGAAMTALVLITSATPASPHISEFFGLTSVTGGHGRNIVNVILVDFRALDTLGETVVIGAAGFGCFLLLRRDATRGRPGWPVESLILRTAARSLVTLLLLLAVFLLLRGHDAPGGGFVGGLVVALALSLTALAHGPAAARRLMRASAGVLFATGLLIALASGVVAVARGQPAFTGQWLTLHIGATEVALGTPFVFDVGVTLIVLGAISGMLLNLEEI